MTELAKEPPSADLVGKYFIIHYYKVLHDEPESLYKFYKEDSVLCFGGDKGPGTKVIGLENINEKIKSFGFSKCVVQISGLDAAESVGDAVLLLVRGTLANNGGVPRKFVQIFLLATQPSGYYVRNDIWRFLEDDVKSPVKSSASTSEPIQPRESSSAVAGDRSSEKLTSGPSSPSSQQVQEPIQSLTQSQPCQTTQLPTSAVPEQPQAQLPSQLQQESPTSTDSSPAVAAQSKSPAAPASPPVKPSGDQESVQPVSTSAPAPAPAPSKPVSPTPPPKAKEDNGPSPSSPSSAGAPAPTPTPTSAWTPSSTSAAAPLLSSASSLSSSPSAPTPASTTPSASASASGAGSPFPGSTVGAEPAYPLPVKESLPTEKSWAGVAASKPDTTASHGRPPLPISRPKKDGPLPSSPIPASAAAPAQAQGSAAVPASGGSGPHPQDQHSPRTGSRGGHSHPPIASVYVSNLPYEIETQKLEDMFKVFGEIKEIVPNRGYAFIEYKTIEAAQRAITATQEKPLVADGRTLKVEEKRTRLRPPRRDKGRQREDRGDRPDRTDRRRPLTGDDARQNGASPVSSPSGKRDNRDSRRARSEAQSAAQGQRRGGGQPHLQSHPQSQSQHQPGAQTADGGGAALPKRGGGK
jgi:hypothetical protein